MSKQTDYLNSSLSFMAHNINPLHTEHFPFFLASHNKKRNSIVFL